MLGHASPLSKLAAGGRKRSSGYSPSSPSYCSQNPTHVAQRQYVVVPWVCLHCAGSPTKEQIVQHRKELEVRQQNQLFWRKKDS